MALFEPVYGGPEQCGVDFDDMDGHIAEEVREAPLGRESAHEGAILKQRDNSRRHAAGDI